MTHAKLQGYMQHIIKGGILNANALHSVNTSMARIWKEARQKLHAPVTALDKIAEVVEPHSPVHLTLFD
jgi:hypothetical protein